jgi:protein Tex
LKLNDKVQVKILEVDTVRKRIALSIKQTQEAPAKKSSGFKSQGTNNKPAPKTEDVSNMNMNDALSMLKKRFGK